MTDMNNLNFPEELYFADNHEWIRPGEVMKVGISDFAQDQLGEIVYIELPEEGSELEKGVEFGSIESVKTVAEVYMPVSGEITAVNSVLTDQPQLINQDPYSNWIIEIRPSNADELQQLMTRDAYVRSLE